MAEGFSQYPLDDIDGELIQQIVNVLSEEREVTIEQVYAPEYVVEEVDPEAVKEAVDTVRAVQVREERCLIIDRRPRIIIQITQAAPQHSIRISELDQYLKTVRKPTEK